MSTLATPSRALIAGDLPEDAILPPRVKELRGRPDKFDLDGLKIQANLEHAWREDGDDFDCGEGRTPNEDAPPPIPTMLPIAGDYPTTPLPVLPMVVLSISMLGEFLSANVCSPFLLFMVKGFDELHDDAEIAFWTGLLVSPFFFSQFLTSLLWATLAEHFGRRMILIVSLSGTAATCLLFGICTSLHAAMTVRLLLCRLYWCFQRRCHLYYRRQQRRPRLRHLRLLLGVWWCGWSHSWRSNPALKWPNVFGRIDFFVRYPYVLPCAIAASINGFGSALSLFLGYDGGPGTSDGIFSHEKRILYLPIPEEDEDLDDLENRTTERSKLIGAFRRKVSDYFALGVGSNVNSGTPGTPVKGLVWQGQGIGGRSSFYGSTSRNTPQSAIRRVSSGTISKRVSITFGSLEAAGMNLAQKAILANENVVNNITELWVAAAMNCETEPLDDQDELDNNDSDADSALFEPSTPHRGRHPFGLVERSDSPRSATKSRFLRR